MAGSCSPTRVPPSVHDNSSSKSGFQCLCQRGESPTPKVVGSIWLSLCSPSSRCGHLSPIRSHTTATRDGFHDSPSLAKLLKFLVANSLPPEMHHHVTNVINCAK